MLDAQRERASIRRINRKTKKGRESFWVPDQVEVLFEKSHPPVPKKRLPTLFARNTLSGAMLNAQREHVPADTCYPSPSANQARDTTHLSRRAIVPVPSTA